jgi:hypothetical protein
MPADVKRPFLTVISPGETTKNGLKKSFHQCRKLYRSYIGTFTSAGSFIEVILVLSPMQEAL